MLAVACGNDSHGLKGNWSKFEVNFDNHAECSITACEQFGQIIAGYVLHHATAHLDQAAVSAHDFHANDMSARRAIAKLLRASKSGADHATDRCRSIVRGIDGQPLTFSPELFVECPQSYTCFSYRNQVSRFMFDDAR